MAPPIISSIIVEPGVIPPGGLSVVTINASDPDAAVGRLTGNVMDSHGSVTEAVAVLTIQDPLTYELVDSDGVGFVITPRSGQPHVFDVVAP